MAALLDFIKKGSTDRSVTIRIIDSTDGTPETGVVFNTSGIDLWYRREGAAKTSITEASLSALTDAHSDGGFLHVSDGEYRLDLPDAAFATGANYVDIGGTVTGMVVLGGRIRLTDFDLESATVSANVTQISGDSTAADNLEAAADGTGYNLGGGSVVAASVSGAVGSVTGNVGGNVTGSVGSVTGAVGSVTGNVGGNVTGSIGSLATQAKADVNAEVDSALADYDAPTKAELDSAVSPLATAANLATIDTVVDGIKAVTDALPDAGALTSIATASALTTVETVVDAIKVETDKLADTLEDDAGTYRFTSNALEQAPTGGSAPTASEIADAVWEEAIADHSGTSGSTAEQLAAAGSAGDPWATALPGSYTSGQAGKIVGDNLNAPVGTVDTVVDAIKAVTDNLPDSGALTSLATAAALATVDGNVDAILDDTGTSGVVVAAGSKTGYTISGTLTTLDALDTAQDAQHATTQAAISTVDGVVDAILVDTAEIGAAGAGLTAVASAANLATVDTVVDAIKAKTDNLPASPAATSDIPSAASVASAVASAASSDPLSVNIKEINDTALTGDGSSTPWGPA